MDRACPGCRAKGRDSTGNHLFLLSDSSGWYCNRCGHWEPHIEGEEHVELPLATEPDKTGLQMLSEAQNLPFRKEYRGIPAFVAEVFGVRMECSPTTGDVETSFYPIKKKGKITAYKTREHPKKFSSFPKGGMKGDTELFDMGS